MLNRMLTKWKKYVLFLGERFLNIELWTRSVFSFRQFIVVPLYIIGAPSGDRLEPLPSMLLVKDHKRG